MSEGKDLGATDSPSLSVKEPRAVLFINSWSSHCGVCGKGAALNEKTHATLLPGFSGETETKGCGVRWTHVSTEYAGSAMEERIRELRPDLPFIGFFDAFPDSDRAPAVAAQKGSPEDGS